MSEKFMKYYVIAVLVFIGIFVLSGIPVSASSLFEVTDENSPFYPELDEEEFTLPDYATNDNGEILVNHDTTLNEVLSPEAAGSDPDGDAVSVSGSDYYPSGNVITYADVENIIEDALEDTRAANLSVANAYLSASIIDVFSRAVDGYPHNYKYVAYRVNSTDANEGYMLIGSDARVNGSYLEFDSGSQLLHYYRTSYSYNYQTYWDYKYDVTTIYDTYRVPYGTGQLIYTNMVKGYPALTEDTENHFLSFVIPVFIAAICLFIIMRRKK